MQKKTPIKAIIWDLDGTLIHFKINSLKARRIAIKILKKYGIPKHILNVKFSILENVNEARKYFQMVGFSDESINNIIQKVDKEIIKIEHEAALVATMINGIDKVVEYAKNKDLKQAIFTFNTKKNAEISLKKVKLLEYFNLIVGRDNIKNLKPHPDHLLYICKNLNVNPIQILVIGDTMRDIEAAINVGAHSIALHTKLTNIETLQKADIIVREDDVPQKMIQEISKLIEFQEP
jgi:HAD superfamily hydrolase (TIGR01549 family)